MARLNDPPAPVESIDALKRRFIRQNREIARVNSTQSLRIRNLETEISRLLAENIALREQAIASAAEAERWRTSHKLSKEVLGMKDRLAAKLQEVNALVDELGGLPEKSARRSGVKRRSTGADTIKSPNEKDWGNRQTLGGVLAGERELQEGRMPAILEDKYYPRRTLEPAELRAIVDDAMQQDSESPELGPPPVAHFDVQDPVAFDAKRSQLRDVYIDAENGMEDVVPLPGHLETRRRRRTSSLLQDMSSLPDGPPALTETARSSLLKSGAKRKLDLSELEDSADRQSNETDDFVFQRKAAPTPAIRLKPSRFSGSVGKTAPEPAHPEDEAPQKQLQSARRVLAPKSTNSPTKTRLGNVLNKGDAKDDGTGRPRAERPRPRQVVKPTGPDPDTEVHEITLDQAPVNSDLQPTTPGTALRDLFSPGSASTEPSARAVNTAKHSEMAVTNSVEDVLNGSLGRASGSRRARAAVSYAEPNLRDKMRRPGREMVGAVEGIVKTGIGEKEGSLSRSRREDAEAGPVEEFANQREAALRVVKIKQDRPLGDGEIWQGLPMAHERSRDGEMEKDEDEPASPLIDKEKKVFRRTKAQEMQPGSSIRSEETENANQSELDNAVSRLSIFDPPTSSPATQPAQEDDRLSLKSTISASSSKPATQPKFRTRRHSVQPSTSSLMANSTASTGTAGASSLAAQPRPSSAAGIHLPDQPHRRLAGLEEVKRPSSVGALHGRSASASASASGVASGFRSASTLGLGTRAGNASRQADELGGNTASLMSRSDRAASRRRSMMI